MIWWSLAAMGTAFARSADGDSDSRDSCSASAKPANFPASIKTVAEWFPKSERAFATGIFNSGTNIGAVVAPIVVPLMAATWGWQAAFIATGALGFVWLDAWWALYHGTRRASACDGHAERAVHPRRRSMSRSPAKVTARRSARYRQLWAFAMRQAADRSDLVVLSVLAAEVPRSGARHSRHGTDSVPDDRLLIADFGSMFGGYLSSTLIKRGWTVNRGAQDGDGDLRRMVPFVIIAGQTQSAWTGRRADRHGDGVHQAGRRICSRWRPTCSRDGRSARSSVSAASRAAIGGILIAEFAGRVLQRDPSYYLPMFIVAGLIYLVALAVIHLLAPRLERVHPGGLIMRVDTSVIGTGAAAADLKRRRHAADRRRSAARHPAAARACSRSFRIGPATTTHPSSSRCVSQELAARGAASSTRSSRRARTPR